MLIFLSRLQRFDRAQEEAALDLGASTSQVFFHILLPFLRPRSFRRRCWPSCPPSRTTTPPPSPSSADKTLTTVLAGRIRQGTTPAISALAVIIIVITLAGAILYEVLKRREDRGKAMRAQVAAEEERGGLMVIEAAE